MPITFVTLGDFTGYRIGNDGSVQTEWKFKGRGRGMPPLWYQSGDWMPLKHLKDKRNRLSVRLRKSEGIYQRVLVPTLVVMAFPAAHSI